MKRTVLKKRVLFVAEAVTLAHIARPLALASALPPDDYDVVLACDERCNWLTAKYSFRVLPIRSISPESFAAALAKGSPIYPEATLRAYVRDDLDLIARVAPDLIVGDFRLSLSVSARLAKVPYATITNAYWSPFGNPRYVAPTLPMTRILPIGLCNAIFRAIRPVAFALHAAPLNRIRRSHGLGSLGPDLRRTYTDADAVLYADVPEVFPLRGLPPSHHYIGSVIWSPPAPTPDWWDTLPQDRPVVYVSLGSSGDRALLPRVITALGELPVVAMLATAGTTPDLVMPPNVFSAAYLPGTEASRRARLVVCNGGSLTCQQALTAGVPLVGIPSNLDQHLNMGALSAIGAGDVVRADRFDERRFRHTVLDSLSSAYRLRAASQVQGWYARYQVARRFPEIVGRMVQEPPSARR